MDKIEDAIDYWKWTELYKPIANHFEKAPAIDGCLYLPSGKQWEFVRQHNDNNIWSLIVTDLEDSDDTLWEIMSGVHYVNRQGYLITEVSYHDDMSVIY